MSKSTNSKEDLYLFVEMSDDSGISEVEFHSLSSKKSFNFPYNPALRVSSVAVLTASEIEARVKQIKTDIEFSGAYNIRRQP